MTRKYDYLIIGGGVAGLSFALKVAATGSGNLERKAQPGNTATDYQIIVFSSHLLLMNLFVCKGSASRAKWQENGKQNNF